MNGDRVRAVATAAVGVVALAGAAAIIGSDGDGTGVGGGDGGGGGSLLPFTLADEAPTTAIGTLPEPVAILIAVVLLASVAFAIVYYPAMALAITAVMLTVMVVLLAITQLIDLLDLTGDSWGIGGDGEGFSFADGQDGWSGITAPSLPSVLLLAIVGIGVLITAVSLARVRSDSRGDVGTEAKPSTSVAMGRVAGRAADRLEVAEGDADVDNEVYRAWREMTTLLDVERPESSTPGEFAAAAVDAGLSQSDVSELTRLFEAVRYGNRDPEGREERASSIFRRIERAYAEAGPERRRERNGDPFIRYRSDESDGYGSKAGDFDRNESDRRASDRNRPEDHQTDRENDT